MNMNINMDINMDIDIDMYIDELFEKGYTIIPNVINENEIIEYINEFNKWMDSYENFDELHDLIHYHGIFKYFNVGHQRFAWLLRTNHKIQNIFKKIWNTDELVTSFDGCCYYPKNYNKKDVYWIHSDQSCLKKGMKCVQSFISLTKNCEKTFLVYEYTHKLHEIYGELYNINNSSDWNPICKEYIDSIHDSPKILHVEPGSMVLWDSRTFHQNTCGSPESKEDRLVQYLCFLPKNHINNTDEEKEKRRYFFENQYTTNHYPYPMTAISKQPNYYNSINPNNKIIIDYNLIPNSYLDDLMLEIEKLL